MLNPVQVKLNNINFGSISGLANEKNEDNFVINSNQTDMFRDDLDWDKLVSLIIDKFPDGGNIFSYGCSDGSEAYSLVIKLIERLGDNKASKYFPIQARDKDKAMIEMGQNGLLHLTKYDLKELQRMHFDHYFSATTEKHHQVESPLRETVCFEEDDINKIKSFPEKPIIFMARNMWPYFDLPTESQLAQNLYTNLQPKSIVILGVFDLLYSNAAEYLEQAGFQKIPEKIVLPTKWRSILYKYLSGITPESKPSIPTCGVFIKPED